MSAIMDRGLDAERIASCAEHDRPAAAPCASLSMTQRRMVIEIATEMHNHAAVIGRSSDPGAMLKEWAKALIAAARPAAPSVESITADIGRLAVMWPEDVPLILAAMKGKLLAVNGHLQATKDVVEALDDCSDVLEALA